MNSLNFMEKLLDGVEVEWKSLGEVTNITIGEFVHQNKQNPSAKYPVYNGGIKPTGYYDNYNNTGNKIIVSARGANAGFVNKLFEPYWAGNSCYSISVKDELELSWEFIFYFLKSNETKLIGSQQGGGGIPAISKKQMQSFIIPIPPLHVQSEIVRILDNFTELTAELTAELTVRKKQFSYYRNKLLDKKVEWKRLGDICKFTYGFTAKAKESGDARFVRISDINNNGKLIPTDAKYVDILEENEKYLLKKNDLLMARTGATYGKTMIYEEDYPAIYAGFLIKLDFDKNINHKFYWHFSQSELFWFQANKLVSGGGQPQFNANALKEVKIPIFSMEEQERIVSILDKFDTLNNSISEGLPKEIELRTKQYEYYRDLLLTFPRQD